VKTVKPRTSPEQPSSKIFYALSTRLVTFESKQNSNKEILQGVRASFVPDFQLKWSGWTAFRGVFDASLTDSIPNLPPDSTHWWGPDTNFFASRLGKNAYTVVGGIHSEPSDPNAMFKDVSWDQEADVKLLREKYAVS
jgi:hypothetical protein